MQKDPRSERERRWVRIAEAYRLPAPADSIVRIAPILEELTARLRSALDRDLSLVEPVAVYRPRRGR